MGVGGAENVRSVTQTLHVYAVEAKITRVEPDDFASTPQADVKGRRFVTVQRSRRAAGLHLKFIQAKIWLLVQDDR